MTSKDFEGELQLWLHQHGLTRGQLETIAHTARSVHAEFKRVRFRQHVASTGQMNEAWLEVAQRAVEQQMSPAEFVSAVWADNRDVYLNVLKSAKVARDTVQSRDDREREIKERVRLQSARLHRWRQEYPNRTLQELLTDTHGQFEPLFVFCIAVWQGLPELADSQRDRANVLLCDYITRKVFSECFPDAFRSRT